MSVVWAVEPTDTNPDIASQVSNVFLWKPVSSYQDSYVHFLRGDLQEICKQKCYRKELLIMLEEFQDKYLQVSHHGLSALTWHHEHEPQETQSSR